MKENEKITQRGKRYSFWVSDKKNCIAFKMISGYREVKVNSNKELWELIHTLIDTGYRIQ